MAQDLGGRRVAFVGLAEGHALPLFAAIVLTTVLASTAVRAGDNYPSRPVQMIIPFSAGGPTDIVGRVMGAKMGQLLGQQFIAENKTGAGGNIGAEAVAKAAPDGYTILVATVSTNAINPGLYKHIPYDAVRDFAPLGRVGVTPTLLLVHPSMPATDVKSLIALIRANPGKYNYGSSGLGSISSSVRRGIQIARRRPRHHACALQGLGADGYRFDGRSDRDGVRRNTDCNAAGKIRQAARARRRYGEARCGNAGFADVAGTGFAGI